MRCYDKDKSIVFCKTRDPFGEFSNMCSDFELQINGTTFQSSEVLYQALKFGNRPDIQQLVIDTKNSMMSKKVSREYNDFVDEDWSTKRVLVMKFCIWVKTMQHLDKMKEIFNESHGKSIVEFSSKDLFWGANLVPGTQTYKGTNALGRLLMELREKMRPVKEVHFVLTNIEMKLLGKDLGKSINKDGSINTH